MNRIFLALFVLVAPIAAAQGPQPSQEQIKDFVDRTHKFRKSEPLRLQEAKKSWEKELRKTKGKKPSEFRSVAAKLQALDAIQQHIDGCQRLIDEFKEDDVFPSLSYEKTEIGAIGKLVDNRVRVVQVIDQQNFIGELTLQIPTRDDFRFIHQTTWFKVGSTAQMIDDERVPLAQVFWVVGNKQYTTVAGGSKTLFMLQEVDPKPWFK